MLSPGREFVGSPPPQIGGNTYHYHHGITYTHVDSPLSKTTPANRKKKSLATRISSQFERFKRSQSADATNSNASRIVNHENDGFSPHFRPRRTFYNVIPPRNALTPGGSMRSARRLFVHPPVSAAVTPSWMDKEMPGSTQPLYVHRPLYAELDESVAINGNVCLCESNEFNGKSCRRCGLERQSSKSKVESWWRDWSQSIRRSQSEESVSTLNNPYEAMRKQRLNSSQPAQQTQTPSTANNNAGRYISGWNNESSGESQNNSEDEERSRAYAEVDLIYNSVRRRALPAMPTLGSVNHYEPQQPQRLQRSSSNVIRRSVILKTPVQHSKMLPKTPNSTTKIYVSNPPMTVMSSTSAAPSNGKLLSKSALNDAEDSSAKESLSEEDDSDTEDPEKLQKLQIRNLKRLREKVKEEEEKLRALKNTAAKIKDGGCSSGSENNLLQKLENDYDGDISAADLESPQKVNKVHLQANLKSPSSTMTTVDSGTESKLMQLYHRRKRQQEQQLRSEFNVKHLDMKELTVKDNIASHQPESESKNKNLLFNDTTRIRMTNRPSIKEAFQPKSALGRRGISQSFKERVGTPSRPKDPPPPPPQSRLMRSVSNGKIIYDIAEESLVETSAAEPGLVILHTNSENRHRGAPSKPPRHKKERSQSFTPNSNINQENSTEHKTTSHVSRVDVKSSSDSSLNNEDKDNQHIYEEIKNAANRPLPPIPPPTPKVSTTSTIVSVSSKLSSLKAQIDEEDVKSIFVGATKYEILNYLEDAKERGVDNINDPINEAENESTVGQLAERGHANRVSQFSQNSSSSNGSSTIVIHKDKDKWTTSVEIERNDSGLGSETGGKSGNKRPPVAIKKQLNNKLNHDQIICEDCDQLIDVTSEVGKSEEAFDTNGSTCTSCSKRRCERKEIITEIIETEIKYGRDLRIILEEFYRPMQVAGLLSHEQLSAIFLNVEELAEVNKQFTENLRDAIEIALDEGDEDLCTVKIGRIFKDAEPMLGAFKSYCTRQGSSSALLATLEKERELLRIFLRVSQMENTILRRMNLSSFLMVPVQRVTKYPLLLSRLLKVTPAHHEDRSALQEGRERIEHHLENMNQEARDTNSTRLWRRISMINVSSYRKMDSQLDVLGNTTWGIRKMALDVLQWTNKSREDVNFVLEGKLMFTQATEANWRPWNPKMTPVSALLVTMGRNSLEPPSSFQDDGSIQFPLDTGVSEAALLLIKEKNNRYSMIRDPIFLRNCIICWEPEWDDCFELNEFVSKESLIFKGEDASRTRQWFKALQFYGLSLGQWRKRRNGLANIMIYGASSNKSGLGAGPYSGLLESGSSNNHTIVSKSSSLSQLVDLAAN